jgi:GMP synthase (glutamine-hydrolysing)
MKKPVLIIRHVPHEGPGTIGDALDRREVSYKMLDAFHERRPTFDANQYCGLVVMGGPMNVDETDIFPFLADEVQWIQQAIERKLPVLGVCLGSQLLAKALGSKVYKNRIKEIGWYDLELLPAAADDPLFHGITSPTPVFQWHGDTFDLPRGAVQLARSPQCENQAFRYSQNAYGLQFHMEVTADIVTDWLCETGNCCELDGLDYIDPKAIRNQTPQQLPKMTAIGERVFDRFAALCGNNS